MERDSIEYQVGQANKRRLVDLMQDRAELIARKGRVLAVDDKADVAVIDNRLATLDAEEAHIRGEPNYVAVETAQLDSDLDAASKRLAEAQAEVDRLTAERAKLMTVTA